MYIVLLRNIQKIDFLCHHKKKNDLKSRKQPSSKRITLQLELFELYKDKICPHVENQVNKLKHSYKFKIVKALGICPRVSVPSDGNPGLQLMIYSLGTNLSSWAEPMRRVIGRNYPLSRPNYRAPLVRRSNCNFEVFPPFLVTLEALIPPLSSSSSSREFKVSCLACLTWRRDVSERQ